MRKIHVTITVEDDEYVEMVELVATSLFKGSPWIPGFIFQRAHGFGLDFEKEREAREASKILREAPDQPGLDKHFRRTL